MRKINNPIPQKIVLTANALKHSPGFALFVQFLQLFDGAFVGLPEAS